MNDQEIEKLLSTDPEDLYVSIGRELSGRTLLPTGDNELIDLAKKWLSIKRDSLASTICNSEKVRQLFHEKDSAKRKIALVFAIFDLISEMVINVSPWTVAALLVNQGMHTLCKDHWKENKN